MKVSIQCSIIITLLICLWNYSPLMASPTMSVSPISDFYSGRDDLKTIGLGRSAYTIDGRTGVGVNIYQKTDGSYIVQVVEHEIINGRQKSTMSKGYIKAWRNKEDKICFIWKNIEYQTGSQIFKN